MEPLLLRGQLITEKDLGIIRSAIEDNPSASRTAISKRLCALWGWYRPNGQPKDCACREIPGSLEARGLISLPAPKVPQEQFRPKAVQPPMLDQSPMGGHLHDYGDASLELVSHAKDFRFCRYLVGISSASSARLPARACPISPPSGHDRSLVSSGPPRPSRLVP